MSQPHSPLGGRRPSRRPPEAGPRPVVRVVGVVKRQKRTVLLPPVTPVLVGFQDFVTPCRLLLSGVRAA